MEKRVPEIIKQAVLKQRAELVSEREQLVRDIDKKVAEIDAFLMEPQGRMFTASTLPVSSTSIDSELSLTRKIKEAAKSLIVPGVHVTTDQIYASLLANGVVMPPMDGKPETARITRIVSGTGLYKGHKTLGWSLKENDPVGAGS